MVFWFVPGLPQAKKFSKEGDKKAEKNYRFKMLKKKLRVSKQIFKDAFKKSRIISSPYFLLRYHKNNTVIPSKFSFMVPKTVSKRAVVRNLIKRRCYSIIQKNFKNIKNSYVLIFSLKKGTEKTTYKEIESEILILLKKSHIIDF
jgi:ribonuclease P protein component